jgi:hypothetical protein
MPLTGKAKGWLLFRCFVISPHFGRMNCTKLWSATEREGRLIISHARALRQLCEEQREVRRK